MSNFAWTLPKSTSLFQQLNTPDPSRPGTVQSMLSTTEIEKIEDVYTKYMKLQKQLEFLEVQEEYIKGIPHHYSCCNNHYLIMSSPDMSLLTFAAPGYCCQL